MRHLLIAALATSGLIATGALVPTGAAAQDNHVLVTPGDVDWAPGPPSIQPGAEAAVLYGNPGEAELFALRLCLPDGYHIAPHTHPRPEIVTVISGTVHIGAGSEADRDAAETLEAGSFFAFEPGHAHYLYAEGETVIQLNSSGPWDLEYVNPDDDPRQES